MDTINSLLLKLDVFGDPPPERHIRLEALLALTEIFRKEDSTSTTTNNNNNSSSSIRPITTITNQTSSSSSSSSSNNIKRSKADNEKIIHELRPLCSSRDTVVRGTTFRTLRFMISGPSIIVAMITKRIHVLIIRALEREPQFYDERMQAFRLVRQWMLVAPELLPRGLVRSIMAIASHRDNQLKEPCIELVREMVLLNTRIVAEVGGISMLINSMLDPNLSHMMEPLAFTLIHLLNDPKTRIWIRPSLDISIILTSFTSSDAKSSEEGKAKRLICRKVLVLLMSSWAGLITLASDNQGLRSLVQMLVQPVADEIRRDVLETILEIFNSVNPLRAPMFGKGGLGSGSPSNTKNLGVHHSSSIRDSTATRGGRKDVRFAPTSQSKNTTDAADSSSSSSSSSGLWRGYSGSEPYMATYWGVGPGATGSKELAAGGFHSERVPGRHTHMHTLLDNFLVIVLLAFVHCGLVEALVENSITSGPPISHLATQLLSFVMRCSSRLLPEVVCRRLLSQKALVEHAARAARAENVADRARSQRAAHVIGLLSRIVGSGYDTALATLLSRSTYEDGIALASELALAGSTERTHLNLGVFPRSVIVSLPTVTENLAAAAKMSLPGPASISSATQGGVGEASGRSSGRSKSITKSVRNKLYNGIIRLAGSSGGEALPASFEVSSELLSDDLVSNALAAPLVANRGHRRLVQQFVLTELSRLRGDELQVLLNRSKVLGLKDRRLYFIRWDWSIIDEIMSGPCQTQVNSLEIMKTKFFKRLCGFFQATHRGDFQQLSWEPDFCAFTNVAAMMIRALLDISGNSGMMFLESDRRGALLRQIRTALLVELSHAEGKLNDNANAEDLAPVQNVITMATTARDSVTTDYQGEYASISIAAAAAASATASSLRDNQGSTLGGKGGAQSVGGATTASGKGNKGGGGGGDDDNNNSNNNSNTPQRLFTQYACAATMTHDFFVLIGVFSGSERGFRIIKQTELLDILTKLSHFPQKDYILRLAIAYLDYTVIQGTRDWLTSTINDPEISTELRLYTVGFLRSLLRSAQTQVIGIAQWILGLLFSQAKFPLVTSAAISVLNEAAHYPLFLGEMIELLRKDGSSEKQILRNPQAMPLILKCLSTNSGVILLKRENILGPLMSKWTEDENREYLNIIESSICLHLATMSTTEHYSATLNTTLFSANRHNNAEIYMSNNNNNNNNNNNTNSSMLWKSQPVPIPVRAHESSALSEPGFTSSELQWLYRIPWRVEVWCEGPFGRFRVPMDSYVDCSRCLPEVESSSQGDTSTNNKRSSVDDEPRGICVMATVTPPAPNSKAQQNFTVTEDMTVFALLSAGNLPIDRRGRCFPSPKFGGGFMPNFVGANVEDGAAMASSIDGGEFDGAFFSDMANGGIQSNHPTSAGQGMNGGGGGIKPHRSSTNLNRSRGLTRAVLGAFRSNTDDDDEDRDIGGGFDRARKVNFHDPIRPLSDHDAWVRCPPSLHQSASFKTSTSKKNIKGRTSVSSSSTTAQGSSSPSVAASSSNGGGNRSISICPPGSSAAFGFEVLEEPRINTVSLSRGGGIASNAIPSSTLALKYVRFYLTLVPHRFAAPSIPAHLLGELAKSPAGVEEIIRSGIVPKLSERISDQRYPAVDRRAALWAIGHIGAAEGGYNILKKQSKTNIVQTVISISRGDSSDDFLSLRGTAIYVLGMFSRCSQGAMDLQENGWATLDIRSHPFATLTVPLKLSSIFQCSRKVSVGVASALTMPLDGIRLDKNNQVKPHEPLSKLEEEIMSCICDLSNHIAQKEAHRRLTRLKDTYPELFESARLLLETHEHLGRYNYELPVRQFLLHMFHSRISFNTPEFWSRLDAEQLR